jgi:tripartite-type tricarboxylate transporter receptor subunit TctC
MMFSVLTQMLPYIQEGRLRGLAISSATRSKLAPDIPTMVESGFPQFVTTSITTVVAPPNTPIEIRRQLSKAVATALASEEVQKALASLGGEARPSSPEELAAFLAEQQQHWSGIIKATKISID